MERPTLTTIDGKEHEMKALTGRTYRVVAEFDKNFPEITDVDFIEKHAAIVAELYDGVTTDDVLDMSLDEILPASIEARNFAYAFTWLKTKEISKNLVEDEAKEQSA